MTTNKIPAAVHPALEEGPDLEPELGEAPERPGLVRAAMVLTMLDGLAIRGLLLVSPIGRPDADEVIAGLMARNISRDGFPLFFWGQHYGGTAELVPVALSIRVFGDSTIALRIPSLVLAAAISFLVWRVASRFAAPRVSQLAGLLSWAAFPPAIWLSAREMLFYGPTVFCGLLAALIGYRISEQRSRFDLAAFWIVLAVGLWESPNIAYFVIPAYVATGWQAPLLGIGTLAKRRLARFAAETSAVVVAAASVVVVLVGAVVVAAGSSVLVDDAVPVGATGAIWCAAQIAVHFRSFAWFFTDGLAGLMGLRELFTYRWIFGAFGVAFYLVFLVVLVSGATTAWRDSGGSWPRRWDLIGLASFPFIFSLVPKATDEPNMRYLYFLVPFVAIAVARVASKGRMVPYTAVLLAFVLSGLFMQRIYVVSEVDRTVRVGNVGDLSAAIAILDEEHVDRVWGSYWVSYRLVFETSERVVAAVPWNNVPRYQRYDLTLRSATRTAWVLDKGRPHDLLIEALSEIGVHALERPAGDFVVVVPDRPVQPGDLSGAVTNSM